jgi:glycosidase
MSILGLEKSYEITNIFENKIRDLNFENQDYFEKMLPVMLFYLKNIKQNQL